MYGKKKKGSLRQRLALATRFVFYEDYSPDVLKQRAEYRSSIFRALQAGPSLPSRAAHHAA